MAALHFRSDPAGEIIAATSLMHNLPLLARPVDPALENSEVRGLIGRL
jgi:hypothetical protein